MSWHVRPARLGDLDALYDLACQTGGGFTNLPMNRDALQARLEWSERSYARAEEAPDNELYLLFLEHVSTGEIGGSALLYSRIGVEWPFYSYKLATIHQTSRELGRSISHTTLNLVNDFNGASEVGGLFLRADLRTGGLGRMLARSRYLFIAAHRARFADRVIAELRGVLTDDGGSPFWDGLGRAFFDMPFQEADRFNAVHGNQFIADLMPRNPIYVSMLPDSARAVIGHPHRSGVPAMKLLESEGFVYDSYVDIFDGGPTMCARTDQIRTVRESKTAPLAEMALSNRGLPRALLASGRLTEFRCWLGHADYCADGLVLPVEDVERERLKLKDEVRHVAF